jgi:hypothetical protein
MFTSRKKIIEFVPSWAEHGGNQDALKTFIRRRSQNETLGLSGKPEFFWGKKLTKFNQNEKYHCPCVTVAQYRKNE